jgi:GT2 family glycosyltransferase
MELSIVIVSYNTAARTLACLESLQAAPDDKEIFVVDNASSDDSVKLIRNRFPEVHLIVGAINRGFAAANNVARPDCRGRYLVFLNPDTTVKPDALKKALTFMDTQKQIGLAGAKILNPDGTLQASVSYKYPGEKFTSGETAGLKGDIACVLGAFMIARKELIDELEGFDEDFFLYGEDQDLCWRIRERRYSIGYIQDAEVFHWGGQSEINTNVPALFEKKLRAEYLFYSKHYRPETISRIKRAQARKARYRLMTLKSTALFARDKLAHINKIQCYSIALNMAKQ